METEKTIYAVGETEPDSDPTYEAWKPSTGAVNVKGLNNSDPTYEAWKLFKIGLLEFIGQNSDPTYEAWKPRT